ncbi:hypothetical protein C2S53_013108 [Perilla frutescens var. hirtella]|uniref:Uncharacterized protein n=1 Tax=Perilla frutescens var. hirtella TaxID=608512 RepID=A0AAD4P1X0_PERFH|nr:hypothetical protein C2S53_013108 [Perilla frutescens var. hirtella]
MAENRIWCDIELRALLDQMVTAAWRVDLTNTYTMGYVVMGASRTLSREFEREVSRTEVVEEIQKLKDQLETCESESFRVGGEPMYRDLKAVFIFGSADVADFDWLLRSFSQPEGVSLSGDHPWPLHNIGMAADWPEEGYGI